MHPYSNQPDRAFWRRFVANTPWSEIDFVGQPKFTIATKDRVSTAGSCFAQHITRHMRKRGISPFQAEFANTLALNDEKESASYSVFSARYGNIYSSRQCLELFQQAFGEREIFEEFVDHEGRYYDLLRPYAIPSGFSSREEAQADRYFHLTKVRQMFDQSDVFILTLGLTEIWYNVQNRYCYPTCPGTARGKYRSETHQFHNLSYAEVIRDLTELVLGIRKYNPNIKFILTVSPVPLVATHGSDNVLTASVYSKSVLRAACGEITERLEGVQYFPSYEITNHVASFGQYLHTDLREISERGVSHVMNCFFDALYSEPLPNTNAQIKCKQGEISNLKTTSERSEISNILDLSCEEVFNDYLSS
jgi:hypothetical protein